LRSISNQPRDLRASFPSAILNGLPGQESGRTGRVFLDRVEEAMPEHRARKHHQDRVAETLREEIGAMIEGELSDPRIDFCYVSEVALNPGGKSARVYVAIDSAVKDIAKAETNTIAGLEAAKGYIRYELKERMGKRHVPELSFLADRSGRFQARIDELMSRSRSRKTAALARENAAASPAAPQTGDSLSGSLDGKPSREQKASFN
jgi:ribosome-binding factor A